ncbi:MAG: serine hydrolase [bacterium]|nr:serine hydrolase [bacterium]
MPIRFYFLFLATTLLLLFYPGEHPFLQIIAYNRDLFIQEELNHTYELHPIPVIDEKTTPYITAGGVYVVELASFTPLYQKNEHIHFFPASTTKIITALVASELYRPDEVITVETVTSEGQVMGLQPGERITAENLLYGALVHSGNDAAFVLADHFGYNSFVERMNTKAQELGMADSSFTNPAGFDDVGQLTSPYDLALAGRALIQNPYLKKMVGTKEIVISDVDYSTFYRLSNVNKLLGEIQGLGGLKTGKTEQAGENLVSFYKHDGHDYIIVVMRSEDRFSDTTALVDWIISSVQYIIPEIQSTQ